MEFSYNHESKIISTDAVTVDIQGLLNDIRGHEAGDIGIRYKQIASASGKETLGGSVSVGITVELLDDWQLQFAPGNYIAKVAGGNLVGGLSGDPIAYSSGVQVLLIQSAASTVVAVGGSALTTEEHNTLVLAGSDSSKARKHLANKAAISPDDLTTTIYEDDGVTPLQVFDISSDKRERVPR